MHRSLRYCVVVAVFLLLWLCYSFVIACVLVVLLLVCCCYSLWFRCGLLWCYCASFVVILSYLGRKINYTLQYQCTV